VTPKVLFVGRSRLALPLQPWLAKKWDALSGVFELRVLNAGTGSGDDRFVLLPPDAAGFYPRLPLAVARELRSFEPDVVIASDPYVGEAVRAARLLARSDAKLVVEVHGDPRTFTRGYGSPARRLVAPAADALARGGIRGADATRALSAFTSSVVEDARGLPATACFPTYSDLEVFAAPTVVPVPDAQRVVFVGALEAYKNIDLLAAAWRDVVRRVPGARLTMVGSGSRRAVVDGLVADLPQSVRHEPELAPDGVVTELDAARALVLPSWPEGLGRVVLEAFARGRTAVATRAGGIVDIVTDGRDGLLVPPDDRYALVEGIVRIVEDQALAERLGAAARETYGAWHQTAADFAAAYRSLVDRVLAGAR
jgi:glycosyltransferase involved in cell wall biosynthesis